MLWLQLIAFNSMLNVMSVLSVIVETWETLLKPFQTKWKGIIIIKYLVTSDIRRTQLCKAILGCQNDHMLNNIGNFCMQEVGKNQAL